MSNVWSNHVLNVLRTVHSQKAKNIINSLIISCILIIALNNIFPAFIDIFPFFFLFFTTENVIWHVTKSPDRTKDSYFCTPQELIFA